MSNSQGALEEAVVITFILCLSTWPALSLMHPPLWLGPVFLTRHRFRLDQLRA